MKYIDNWNIGKNIKTLLMTVMIVLTGKGAKRGGLIKVMNGTNFGQFPIADGYQSMYNISSLCWFYGEIYGMSAVSETYSWEHKFCVFGKL